MPAETPWDQAAHALADARQRVIPSRGRRRRPGDPDHGPRLRLVGAQIDPEPLGPPPGERPPMRMATAETSNVAAAAGRFGGAVGFGGSGGTRRSLRMPAAAPASAESPDAIVDPLDPRWVLALRTADSLQGSVLPPERRDALLRIGRVLGLTPFEANLVIAIVQDQARRGIQPERLAAMAEPALRMVPRHRESERRQTSRWRIASLVVMALLAELAAMWWWLT